MAIKITDGFGPGDDEKAVAILKKWNGGPLSDELFTTVAKLTPQVGITVVIYRLKNGNDEILLLPRPEGDILWRGKLNLPGKMFRSIDFQRADGQAENGPFSRIEADEIKSKFVDNPKYAGISYQDTPRGQIVVIVYTAQIIDPEKTDENRVWVNVDNINEVKDLIASEKLTIETALKNIK